MDMMNRSVRKSRLGLVFGALSAVLLGVTGVIVAPSAEGADALCATGFRGDPAYDRACLVTGTREDAAVAWYVGYTERQRNADCKAAQRQGMVTVVRETRGDVLTDNFRNGQQMIRWTASMGVADCQARGY